LDYARVDVLRVGELVLVEDVVFDCGSYAVGLLAMSIVGCLDEGRIWGLWSIVGNRGCRGEGLQPDSPSCAFDIQASSVENCDLGVGGVVDVVVCGPEPDLFTSATLLDRKNISKLAFSKYNPAALGVICMDINAPMQFVLTAELLAVTGHCATCKSLPTNPPTRVCTSHIPLGVPLVAKFHSISVAPACAPCVLTIISLHSTCPVCPLAPTLTTGCGLLIFEKKDPLDRITG